MFRPFKIKSREVGVHVGGVDQNTDLIYHISIEMLLPILYHHAVKLLLVHIN